MLDTSGGMPGGELAARDGFCETCLMYNRITCDIVPSSYLAIAEKDALRSDREEVPCTSSEQLAIFPLERAQCSLEPSYPGVKADFSSPSHVPLSYALYFFSDWAACAVFCCIFFIVSSLASTSPRSALICPQIQGISFWTLMDTASVCKMRAKRGSAGPGQGTGVPESC